VSAQSILVRPSLPANPVEAGRAELDIALFARRDAGDARARDQLVERFLPLARSIARRYQRSEEPWEDLMQVAAMGLVKAVDGFDTGRGVAFSSYAVPTIAGELKRYFRDRTWMVRPPRDLQELTMRLECATKELSQQLDRAPTVRELADHLEVNDEHVLEALHARAGRGAVSFTAPIGDDGHCLQDTLGAADDAYELADTRVAVDGMLRGLTPRMREILRLRFEEDLTQAEIGAVFGVSQMQISRLIRQALKHLRDNAEDPQGVGRTGE
jgi:RNA polymerase sigma-B factor